MGSGKKRWKISFHWSPSNLKKQPPNEFICPISGTLMADPVIVSSGHTFERNCVQACKSLSFKPILSDASTPDFSTVIPNLALKSTILNWSHKSFLPPPKPLDLHSAENLVRELLQGVTETELTQRPSHLSSSSEESVTTTVPISSSSSDIETLNPNPNPNPNPNSSEEDEFVAKLKSSHVFEQEEALISLREKTKTREDTRAHLCTPRLLSALRSSITSRYASIQVNSVAALVNLSLDDTNKVKIVRSGIIPPLIDVLRGGFPEAQDHAAGALFSLSLNDHNKTAIGVLGALPPLLHALRSESERTRHDSALALYHLSLVQSNQAKLVKLGSVQVLLGMVRSGHMTGRILLVLSNIAASVEGRGAMLDGGAVGCLVGMLSRGEFDSVLTQESCVTALHGLSHGGLRFKGLAMEAGVEEVLRKVEKVGSERAKAKARRMLEVMRVSDEEEREVDWGELLNSGEVSRTRYELSCGSNSSEF